MLAAAGTGGWFGYHYLMVGRFLVTTDDAYVQAYNTTMAAKVAGYVASVPVTDNVSVHAGDVIATIDDGNFQLAAGGEVRDGLSFRAERAGGGADEVDAQAGADFEHGDCQRVLRSAALSLFKFVGRT